MAPYPVGQARLLPPFRRPLGEELEMKPICLHRDRG